jgi:hypothetical protein
MFMDHIKSTLSILQQDWPEHARNSIALFLVPHGLVALMTLSNAETAVKIVFSIVSMVCLILVTRHKLKSKKDEE